MSVPIAVGVNEKTYAAQCVEGDLQAGVRLVRSLWEKGYDATVLELLDIAFPAKDGVRPDLTRDGFDNLADARAEAIRHREYARRIEAFPAVMSAGGIPDVDPVVDDIAMGD